MTIYDKTWLSLACLIFVLMLNIVVDSIEINYQQKNDDITIGDLDKFELPKIEYVKDGDQYRYHRHDRRRNNRAQSRLDKLRNKLNKQCGIGPVPYIAGGRDAKLGEFPAYVYMQSIKSINLTKIDGTERNYKDASNCGGTILSKTHILTAAHCVWRYNTLTLIKPTFVRPTLNFTDPAYPSSMVEIEKICVSDDWKNNAHVIGTDLAILKLKKPLEFNENIQSVCLPRKPLDRERRAFAIGLGQSSEGLSEKNTLQVLAVKQYMCDRPFNYPGNICFNASQNLGTICHGDSGGPVIAEQHGKWTTFGVTSKMIFTIECEDKKPKRPQVFMDTYFYRDEILTLIDRCR